jgi:hypothetical protein
MVKIPPKEYLSQIFDYCDGELYWKVKKSDKIKIGQKAGSKSTNGYYNLRIDGVCYKLHRVIYAFHFDSVPEQLDHIDGNPSNNKIENLRPCNYSENGRNRAKQVNNTSGYKGVSFHKHSRKWLAFCDGKGLGYFNTPEQAYQKVCEYRNYAHKDFSKN